ncbi:hypothetical protein JXB22_05400 [candidate division WOR-3 bacterium]|nr:hypothetical protein [candidate division WOR-3 bacterium]
MILLLVPGAMLYAQDETPPKKQDGTGFLDTAPVTGTVSEAVSGDSVQMIEALTESLAVEPSLGQPVTPALQPADALPQYEFKGSGRDIVIGAAVLTGWLVVAFLAANQRSE